MTDLSARVLELEQKVQDLSEVVYLLLNNPAARTNLMDGPVDSGNLTRWIDVVKSAYSATKVGSGATDTVSEAESKTLMLYARKVKKTTSTYYSSAERSRIPILFPDNVVADLFVRRVYLSDHDPANGKYSCAALPLLGY